MTSTGGWPEVSLLDNMKLGIEPTIGHNNLIRSYVAFLHNEKIYLR